MIFALFVFMFIAYFTAAIVASIILNKDIEDSTRLLARSQSLLEGHHND